MRHVMRILAVRRRCALVAAAAVLLGLGLTGANAAEQTVQNDFWDGVNNGLEADFASGEEGGVVLTSPCNGSIVAIQVGWVSTSAATGPSLQRNIWVYSDVGTFPTPGPVLLQLEAPVLTDGALNEFRFVDENMTVPINIPVTAGQSVYVTLEFDETTNVGAGTPSLFHDLSNNCLSGRNVLFGNFGLGNGWWDLCNLGGLGFGISGNLVIRAVVDCQEPTGACCEAGGICTPDVEQGDCQGAGTTWFQGVSCTPNPCPEPTGACCNGSGGCLADQTQDFCENTLSGFYAGDGTTCVDDCDLGACCMPDGMCQPLIEVVCLQMGGSFQGPGTDCGSVSCPQPVGACCIGETCVPNQTEEDCDSFNGTWQGIDSMCTPDPCLAPSLNGDFDNDGDVDLSDFAQFSLCFGGPNVPPAGSCPPGIDADFDNDGDVDLSDFAEFSLNFTGPL